MYLHTKSERRRRSAGERDDGPPQLKSAGEWFAERMGESSIFLDESRLQVVREAALTLEQLVSGQLVGANGFCRLVLGGKGVGKSSLLSGLAECASERFRHRGLVAVPLDGTECRILPVDVISRACNVRLRASAPDGRRLGVGALAAALAKKGLFVLLLVDDVQEVFAYHPDGAKAVAELTALGGSTAGRVYVVMTGRSSVAGRLCFGTLRMGSDEAAKFRWYYSGRDMNDTCTKYNAVTINPFLGADFRDALDAMRCRLNKLGLRVPVPAVAPTSLRRDSESETTVAADSDVSRLFLVTKGVPRAMEAVLRGVDVSQYAWVDL